MVAHDFADTGYRRFEYKARSTLYLARQHEYHRPRDAPYRSLSTHCLRQLLALALHSLILLILVECRHVREYEPLHTC